MNNTYLADKLSNQTYNKYLNNYDTNIYGCPTPFITNKAKEVANLALVNAKDALYLYNNGYFLVSKVNMSKVVFYRNPIQEGKKAANIAYDKYIKDTKHAFYFSSNARRNEAQDVAKEAEQAAQEAFKISNNKLLYLTKDANQKDIYVMQDPVLASWYVKSIGGDNVAIQKANNRALKFNNLMYVCNNLIQSNILIVNKNLIVNQGDFVYLNPTDEGKIAGDIAYAKYMDDYNIKAHKCITDGWLPNITPSDAKIIATKRAQQANDKQVLFINGFNIYYYFVNNINKKLVFVTQDEGILRKRAWDKTYVEHKNTYNSVFKIVEPEDTKLQQEASEKAYQEILAVNLNPYIDGGYFTLYQDPDLKGKVAGDSAYASCVNNGGNNATAQVQAIDANNKAYSKALAFNLTYNLILPVVVDFTIYQDPKLAGKIAGDLAYANYLNNSIQEDKYGALLAANLANSRAQELALSFNLANNLLDPNVDLTLYQDPKLAGKIAGDAAYADEIRINFRNTYGANNLATIANQKAQNEAHAFNLKYNLTEKK